MITVGIIGSTGYTAGELIRCLLNHPNVKIDFLFSHSQPGKSLSDVHQDLFAHKEFKFTNKININVDVVFLCLGHGNSSKFLTQHAFNKETKIIDLSNDFRLINNSKFKSKSFVYGLPELNYKSIKSAKNIANPGCFATAIQLSLLPLAKEGLLQNTIHTHAITGSTGAGQKPMSTTHFSWRTNNISTYKMFRHQHLDEIKESILCLQSNFSEDINFLPVRGNFTRGIFVSTYLKINKDEMFLKNLYESFYENCPFTHVSDNQIHLKQVINTNNCLLNIETIDGKIIISSCIDNLLKGAAGQAIQNLNIMFNLPEQTGLNLKAVNF